MKRAGYLFDQIADRENLRLATYKALKGKRTKVDARAFVTDLEGELLGLHRSLHHGDVEVGVSHQFTIFDPKKRLITAPAFRERVLHQAIMNLCEPLLNRRLIDDTYACRKGKGQLAALHRACEFAGRYPFFLKLDIRKYFDSIDHFILLSNLSRVFKDQRLLVLLERIIAAYHVRPLRGIPIGSLTSQHFANFYLSGLDRFVKQELGVKGYVRYMDDFALWAETSVQLKDNLRSIETFLLDKLSLELKPFPYINRSTHGMNFLGCRVHPDHLTLNRQSRVRFRRGLRDLERSFLQGEIDEATLQHRGTAYVASVSSEGISSWNFRKNVLTSMPVSGQRPRTV